MSFKEFVHFFEVVKFMGIMLFITFPCHPFCICRICSDVPSPILCLQSFFCIRQARGLSMLVIFPYTLNFLYSCLSAFALAILPAKNSHCHPSLCMTGIFTQSRSQLKCHLLRVFPEFSACKDRPILLRHLLSFSS